LPVYKCISHFIHGVVYKNVIELKLEEKNHLVSLPLPQIR